MDKIIKQKDLFKCPKCETLHSWKELCPICYKDGFNEANSIILTPRELENIKLEDLDCRNNKNNYV